MAFRIVAGAASLALAACGGALSPRDAGTASPEVASVRLFDTRGPELTQHIPLVTGEATRIRVRLFAPDGEEILSPSGGVELGFGFTPASLASSAPVAAEQLIRDVTPTAPAGTNGTLRVTVLVVRSAVTRTFGPFDALVH